MGETRYWLYNFCIYSINDVKKFEVDRPFEVGKTFEELKIYLTNDIVRILGNISEEDAEYKARWTKVIIKIWQAQTIEVLSEIIKNYFHYNVFSSERVKYE